MWMVRAGMLLIGLVAFVAPAAAEDKVAARAAFDEGTRHYDLAQYDEALTAFKRAYWSYEEPTFLFNIAQCQRALGHKEDALQMYRNYLRKLPEASNRAETQRLIVELEDAIARDKAARAAQPAPPPPAPLPAPSPDQARPAPTPAVVATAPAAKP